MDSRRGRSSKDAGTSSGLGWLGYGKSEDFDLVDPEQKADNKKQPIRPCSGMTVYMKSNPFISSSGSTSSGTTASTTGTINYSSFPPPNSAAGNPPVSLASSSSGYSWIDSTSQNYIPPSTPSTSTMRSACSPSSSTSSSSGSASTTSSGNHDSLKHLTPEEMEDRRKDQERVASRTYRKHKKEQQTKLESNLARLNTRNDELRTQEATLERELGQVRSELELLRATRSISTTCPYCEAACQLLHLQEGHEDLLRSSQHK